MFMSGSLIAQRPGAVLVCLKLALLPALLSLSSIPCSGWAFAPPRGAVRLTRIDGPLLSGLRWPGLKPSSALATASSSGDFGYTSDPADDGGVLYPDQSLQPIIKMEHVDGGGGGFNSMDGGAEKGSLDTREGSAITISELFRRPLTAGSLQESKSTPPGLMWRAGVKGMVPMAAVIGLLLTPSRYLAAKVAGGVVLATIANAARQVAVATKKRQAPEALLELLREKGAGVVMREELADLGGKFFVKEPELWKSSRVLYSAILTDTVTDHRTNADDLDILSALKGTLGLGHEDVAACHHEVIADGLSSVDHPVSMDKILYLSERMFYQEGTTDAGYLDQCGKLRNQLGGMSQEKILPAPLLAALLLMALLHDTAFQYQVELLRKVTQYAAPFYESVLKDVVSRPESFSGEVLLRTRRRLGVSEVVAGGMHLDVYQSAIQGLLDTHGRLGEGDRIWLGRLRGIMGVSQFEGERALESVTAPVYRVAVQAAFAEATEMTWGEPGVDSLRAKLRAKQGDLQLSMAAADSVVKETIRRLSLLSLERALLALRRGGVPDEDVLKSLSEVFRLKEVTSLLMQDYPDDLDADCSRFFSGVLVGSPSLRLSDSEKKEIYRIHLDDVMKDMRLDERDKASLRELRGMLQLEETEGHRVYLYVVNPLLAQKLEAMVGQADLSREDVAKLKRDLSVPHEVFLDACMEAYHARLTKLLSGDEGGLIHSDIEKASLDSVAEALSLSKGQLATIHDITCGLAFKSAAMEILWEAELNQGGAKQAAEPPMLTLESLRSRLGMSIDGARAAFVGAFYEFVSPKVKQIAGDVEALREARRVMPPSISNGKGDSEFSAAAGGEEDVSHSDKLAVRAADIVDRLVGLAAFSKATGASRELEVAPSMTSAGRGNAIHTVDLDQAVAPRTALDVYTFFLEEAFSPSHERIDEALVRRRGALSLALGLNRASVMDAQRGVASRLYLTFLQGTLERKCRLDPVDLASLKIVEEELGMTAVVCQEILARGKKSFVRRKVDEAGLRATDDPACARSLRECADGLGVSLRDDLALPEERRQRMFEAEARAVMSEELDAASVKSTLELVCSSLGLPERLAYDIYIKSISETDSEVDGKIVIADGSVTVRGAGGAIEGGNENKSGDGNADRGVGDSRGITNPSATLATPE